MTRKAAGRTIATICLATVMSVGSVLARQTPPARSVWTGVYSAAQAKRGATVYAETCTQCHGDDLTGVDDAAPLVGATFLSKWNGQPMADLLEQTQKSMPKDGPGTLTRQQYVDVLAFVLKANAYPAGDTELPREIDALKQIRIDQVKK